MRRRPRHTRNPAATLALAWSLGLMLPDRSANARLAVASIDEGKRESSPLHLVTTDDAAARWSLLQEAQHADRLENTSTRRR